MPSYDLKIIVGGNKGNLGKEIWTGIFLCTCLYRMKVNGNETRAINDAAHHRMVTGETLFTYINIHKGKWLGPGDRNVNRIDHIMID